MYGSCREIFDKIFLKTLYWILSINTLPVKERNMNKYFGWLFALAASMTMISAYAEEVSEVEEQDAVEENLAVVLDDDADEADADDE